MTTTITHFAGQPVGDATYENLDHLLQLEMRPYGLTQGVIPHLYRIARPRGAAALTRQAAAEILYRPGTRVAIFTGLFIPGYMPHGETDGPLGAVVLARALNRLGYTTTIVTEPEITDVVRGVAQVIGEDGIDVLDSSSHETEEQALAFASGISIGIAIEKLGVNGRGVRHTVGGNAVDTGDPWAETCIEAIRRQGGFTVGIGDNGNEIGFGGIAPLIRSLVPRGETCRCGCGDGIVTAQGTDLVVPCAVSNYGGYAITAALACLAERPDLLVTGDEVERMLRRALELGCVNGGLEEDGFVGDDGVPLDAAVAYVTLIATVARQYFVRVGDHH